MKYKIELWKGADSQWYWHICSVKNGQIVLTSEGYSKKSNCTRSISKIMESLVGKDWKSKYKVVELML